MRVPAIIKLPVVMQCQLDAEERKLLMLQKNHREEQPPRSAGKDAERKRLGLLERRLGVNPQE